MEISSMGSMAEMMGMQGGKPPEKPDAKEMSSNFMDALDSDGDGALSLSEFAINGDTEDTQSTEAFDALDTNEDGFVSQDELEADMQSNLDAMKAKMDSGVFGGINQNGDPQAFQALMDMAGSSRDGQTQGAEKYGQMQEGMFGEGDFGGQPLSAGLNLRA